MMKSCDIAKENRLPFADVFVGSSFQEKMERRKEEKKKTKPHTDAQTSQQIGVIR